MTSAFAPADLVDSAPSEQGVLAALAGAQNLLTLKSARQHYFAEAVAIGVYALILAAALNYQVQPQAAPPEEPLELVMEAPPPPVEEPKPPEPQAVQPPEPQVEEPPPPPVVEKAVAPIEPPKPKPIPKPVVKHVKPVEKVEPRPVSRAPERRPTIAAPVRTAPPPPGATPSAIANQIHARLMRAAANAYPESQKPRSARISYRVSVDASGHITSFSISPSGNAAFDSVASRLGGRIGTVDAPGRAASLSGVISFAYR
ncbi:energy transducer TonB [uncultured Rhodoblastus sp.]|uniref:energy transducer TonB n=1 Tax=uncultured Rhodoblastus sp. TaxID=543037 RepID=UPI0025EB95B7|nr:energy transducer TonB [uncultured Rhodoblastus sp.]